MKKIKKILSYLITITALIVLVLFYNKYNFNNFDKSIKIKDATIFTRDHNTKYSKMSSYKIENIEYSDAMISQKIDVVPNTPYKVTCMVKTENIQNENEYAQGGAHICIDTAQERSISLTGTNDWQQLTFMFNSRNQTEINVGFRIGGYETNSKGTVWFSDFKIERGATTNTNNWNMACFIFPSIDVNVEVNGAVQHVKLDMSNSDIVNIQTNVDRYKNSIREVSNGKITINCDSYVINEPIKTLSYEKENGYYVSAADVYDSINEYVEQNEYDYIYVAFRMADTQKGENVLVNDWIGLGGMDYYGIGFSNIRMPDDRNNIAYEYNYNVNTYPEEVFLHEFLHNLERIAKECGYDIPNLHDYAQYGYTEDKTEGLKKWYQDYMAKEIVYNGNKYGLPQEIYNYKPAHNSQFKYATQLNVLNEPSNIIEEIQSIITRVKKMFKQSNS